MTPMLKWLDYFKRNGVDAATANVAKNRLSIIVAREGRSHGQHNYLPQLRQELLQVLAKYEKIDLDQVSVSVESQGSCEVLELNVILSNPSGVKRRGENTKHAPFFSEASAAQPSRW
jgi:cell division topological specificity factor